jgi:hypothetical protein
MQKAKIALVYFPNVCGAFLVGILLAFAGVLNPQALHAARHWPCCGEITAAGQRLAERLDAMDVEALWLAHQHVNWETREGGAEYEGPRQARALQWLAAAAAKRLGVYLLRPPEHGQQLLANAQAKWLGRPEGQESG